MTSAALVLSSCADGSGRPTEPTGSGRLTLEVAPLNLPGIDEACYALEVANNASGSSLVFSEPSVCSTNFGDGKGAITFIGACDAQADAAPLIDGIQNRVELRLNSLSSTTGDLSAPADFVNPCGDDQCVQYATCTENTDTSVTFNLTIMRSADQGFFDIGVNFSDVFCSAKVDCPPQLLFNDAGVRGPTAVVAFACTAGDTGPTYMYLDNIAFAGLTYDIRGVKGNKDANDSAAGGKFAVFKDQEDLPGYTKYFWNVALDITGKSGNIVTKATASGEPFASYTTPTATRYPVIDINVAVSNGSCSPNPLDGSGSGVTTGYTTLAATKTFQNEYGDCATGLHLESGVCVSNTRTCAVSNGSGSQTWTGAAWGACAATSCNTGYHVASNACVADSQSCTVANGTGSQTWTGSGWGPCTATSCNTGYILSSGTCVSSSGNIVTGGLMLHYDAANAASYSVASPSTWFDLTGSSRHGTLTNGPVFEGLNGGAIAFDGSNDSVINNTPVSLQNASFSMEAWIRPGVYSEQRCIFGKGPANNPNSGPARHGIHWRFTGNNVTAASVRFGFYASDMETSGQPVTLNEWNHVFVTYAYNGANNVGSIYVNGVAQTLNYPFGQPLGPYQGPDTSLDYVGTWSPGVQNFKGHIAVFRIYNRELSSVEVLQNYNATKSRYGF